MELAGAPVLLGLVRFAATSNVHGSDSLDPALQYQYLLVCKPLPRVTALQDEPTSGLDSAGALSLCKTLKDITDLGLTVVAVIHQPRPEIFEQVRCLCM